MTAARPPEIDPLAAAVLDRLAGRPASGEIVLGGYFALQHYAPYRTTHDIDAWWKTLPEPETLHVVREAMKHLATAKALGYRERTFGDTWSFELAENEKRVFSFQIAIRSVSLEGPVASAWTPILLETLSDNIGSKMNALVDRGSPRDFTDIKHVVDRLLVTRDRCWELWSMKNPGVSVDLGRQKVLLHLKALEARRPLARIADPLERERAAKVRDWFGEVFVRS